MKAPTGDPDRFDGSGSWDEGIGLLAGWRLGRSSLHFGAQASWLGSWTIEDAPTIGHRFALFGGYAFGFSPRLAFVGQILSGHGPFPGRNGGDLGDPTIEIAAGLRHAGSGENQFDWALLENLTSRLNTPDFGFYLGWARRIGPGPRRPAASLQEFQDISASRASYRPFQRHFWRRYSNATILFTTNDVLVISTGANRPVPGVG